MDILSTNLGLLCLAVVVGVCLFLVSYITIFITQQRNYLKSIKQHREVDRIQKVWKNIRCNKGCIKHRKAEDTSNE